MLKNFLEYKSQQAARAFEVVDERYPTVTCFPCGALTGPRGVNGLIVRSGYAATVVRCTTETSIRLGIPWPGPGIGPPCAGMSCRTGYSAEQRLSRSRGRERISQGGGMRTDNTNV
jgi:hypothetical protein